MTTDNENEQTSTEKEAAINQSEPPHTQFSEPKCEDVPKDETHVLAEENAKLKAEIESLKEGRLRLLAEFDNYKKRSAREQIQLIANASEAIIKDILPILENLDRALHPIHRENEEAFQKGVELIHVQFLEILKKAGIEECNPLGETFSPDLHEALFYEVSEEYPQDKISKVLQKGYCLNGKVIQYAKVGVSKGNS
ncbi:MAG: nucleotide exchange factor GrpE [Elusimicrobia bacterium RIFOXYB2_FULL_49_7]|nr:MAG: nucleotide exchange factor GrpE [Elusimicrobia bacterium RIFOXYB2_FULL_49_7]